MEPATSLLQKRSLHLSATAGLRLALDGPSLLVSLPGRAAARYPFRFLRQILLWGPVSLPPSLLEAVLQAGIAVSFFRNDGAPLGYLWPEREPASPLAERLDLFWERQDWHWKYENWRRAQERQAIRESLQGLPWQATDLRPDAVQRFWLRWLRHKDPLSPLRLRLFRHCTADLTQDGFRRAGLTLSALGRRTALATLPADFADILHWRHYRDHFDATQARPAPSPAGPVSHRDVIAHFELLRDREQQRFLRLLDRFDYFLGGLR